VHPARRNNWCSCPSKVAGCYADHRYCPRSFADHQQLDFVPWASTSVFGSDFGSDLEHSGDE